MKNYELIYILTPTIDDEQAAAAAKDVHGLVEKIGAPIKYAENWGRRKLAYEVKKQRYGYYFLVHLECDTDVLNEVDRNLKLSELVIKFMIVRLEDDEVGKASPFKAEKPKEED